MAFLLPEVSNCLVILLLEGNDIIFESDTSGLLEMVHNKLHYLPTWIQTADLRYNISLVSGDAYAHLWGANVPDVDCGYKMRETSLSRKIVHKNFKVVEPPCGVGRKKHHKNFLLAVFCGPRAIVTQILISAYSRS